MPVYTCEKCATTFKQKSQYDNHMKRKTDCSKTTKLKEVVQTAVKEIIAAQSNTDITKETLPSFFEALHNLLWNKAGLNPERALEHMTFFFAYRLIEQQADALILPQECRWSYIASLKNENDLFETIKKGVASFRSKPITKPFFKPHEIQKADIIYEIVRQINRISLSILQETDTLGDIFEYMLGRGMSTMSDEGQYFTNRAICKLAFKLAFKIKQTVRREDGSLCTFADWFCGTGGFPAEYVKGVTAHTIVDWEVDSGSIYCQDMNVSSITTTLLNMLILTGVPFGEKIRSSNSFSDAITKNNNGALAPFPDLTIDYCFMNPPYGGDKTKGKDYKFAYSKKVDGEKRYFVNQEIQSIGIEDDDKVSAGVQLAMASLSQDGVCCIVLPQGFFFGASKKYVELRKKIAEEYKIWYIVDIASGSFLNTGTKTSMMVFQKGGTTDKVSFIGINETLLVETTLEELRKKQYSFNYKKYLLQTIVAIEGFEMVKLGDIVEWQMGKRIVQNQVETGKYPVYGGGDISFYTNNSNRNGINCKISREGMSESNCVLMITGDYYQNSQGMTVVSKKEHVLNSYIWNWLIANKKEVYECGQGTGQKAISMSMLNDLQIPIPSLERQQHIVNSIDGWSSLVHQEETSIKLLENQLLFHIKEMGRGIPRMKLGDLCEFKRGKVLTKKDFQDGNVPVIGGGIKPVGNHSIHNRESYTILISQSGTAGHISRYSEPVWASDCFSLEPKSMITNDFLYYSVLQLKDVIDFLKDGTAQPHVYPSTIETLEIPLPPLVEQQCLQEDFDEIKHKHKKIAIYKLKAHESIQRFIPTM
jgi:type I restriction enzyme S subunit